MTTSKRSCASWSGWAVERPGLALYVQAGGDEATAWQVALGWPDDNEIESAKANGARAIRVVIKEIVQADHQDRGLASDAPV